MKVNKYLAPILEEWRKNNRFRMGALLISGILIFYFFLLMHDANEGNKRNYSELLGKLATVEPTQEKEIWSKRQTEAKAFLENLEGKFWRANSRGMARALVQAWVDGLAKEYKIPSLRIRVELPVDVSHFEGIWEVVATLDADLAPENLHDLLRVLETYPKLVSIEKLFVTEHGMEVMDPKRFTLVLKAYFKAETSESS